jgi:hypothetical protein
VKLVSIEYKIESSLSRLRVDGIPPINRAFSHANLTQNLAAIVKQAVASPRWSFSS